MFRVTIILTLIMMLVLSCGCAASIPEPAPLEYREIPAALLQECVLPPVPLSNGEMSDAFAQAYQCGEQGNRDKERIKNLSRN